MNTLRCAFLASLAVLFAANQAMANPCPPGNPPTNCAPPTGAIYDLNGTPVPHVYTEYFTSFVAAQSTTNLSFSFREDPAFLSLDDVSMTTGGGPNLVLNPGFEANVGTQNPTDWSYLNTFGVGAAGVVEANNPHSGSNNWYDGAIQGYDGLTQAIATTVGATYNISFWLDDNGPLTTFSDLSTNGNTTGTGGNGIDVLVYAGAIPTISAVPEPATLTLVGFGLVAAYRRRRRA
jgi:hypothetical protein